LQEKLNALIKLMYDRHIFYTEAVDAFRRAFITIVLAEHKGNVSEAAKALGMHRNSVSRAVEELHIDVREIRSAARRPPRSIRPAAIRKIG
jgi:Fis family transcriptional regulator, factor for inversion stimulation protein